MPGSARGPVLRFVVTPHMAIAHALRGARATVRGLQPESAGGEAVAGLVSEQRAFSTGPPQYITRPI
jgi:hypothetical protein